MLKVKVQNKDWLVCRQNHNKDCKSIAAIVDVVYYGCKTKCKHRSYILLKKIIQKNPGTYLCEDHDNQGPTVGLREGSFGYQSNYV